MRDKLIDLITIGIARACVKEANGIKVDKAVEIADVLLEHDDRKSTEVAKEILDIIEQRIIVKRNLSQGIQDGGFWDGVYVGKLEAYQDIKDILEQKYPEDTK